MLLSPRNLRRLGFSRASSHLRPCNLCLQQFRILLRPPRPSPGQSIGCQAERHATGGQRGSCRVYHAGSVNQHNHPSHKLPESRNEKNLFHGSWNLPRIFREVSCSQFCWKLKDENWRHFFAQVFATLLAHVDETFRQNFALGNFAE